MKPYEAIVWQRQIDETEAAITRLLPRTLPGHTHEEENDGLAGRRRGESIRDYKKRCDSVVAELFEKLGFAEEKLKEARK